MAYAARTREDEYGVVLTARDEAGLRAALRLLQMHEPRRGSKRAIAALRSVIRASEVQPEDLLP